MSTTIVQPVTHDPNAVLDYRWDWAPATNGTGRTDWLEAGETITATTVTGTGCTVDSSSITDAGTSVTAWISGGTVGAQASVTCHITTSAGREDDRTIRLRIAER